MKPKLKHLLIDGYNVIHAWPELTEILDFDPSIACNHLANAVKIIHDAENIHTTLVFDGKGRETSIERPTHDNSFSLVFTSAGLCADSFIEQYVHKNQKSQSFIVVSRDNLLIETISSLGAVGMRPSDLKAWVNQANQLQREKIHRHNKNTQTQWKRHDPWNKLQ